jgi:hypothetical protein
MLVLDPPERQHVEVLSEFVRKGGTIVLATIQPGGASNITYPWREAAPVLRTDQRVTYTFGAGRVVEALGPIADPNAFALEIRQLLGRERRAIEIWNGITVVAAPYSEPGGETLLVTLVNYAHQPLPVQVRVPGLYSQVEYESPDDPAALVPYQHREGSTEFVLPALRIGGRVFLSR